MIVSDDLLDTLHRRIEELKRQVAALQALQDQSKPARDYPVRYRRLKCVGSEMGANVFNTAAYDTWIFKDAARGQKAPTHP